jgi:4-hydroxybenzoate polyprenyltransferase
VSGRGAALLRLVRAGLLFSPGADVVAGACLAGLPWSALLVHAVLASTCVYAGGMVLNDHADRAEDAVHRPERPIPSGQVAPGAALAFGLGLLALGVAIAPQPLCHAVLAVLVLLYDYVLKRRTDLTAAVAAMSTLRALNLVSGTLAAPAPAWPPLVVAVAAGAYWLYVGSVTVLGALEDVRAPARPLVLAAHCVPAGAAAVALAGAAGSGPAAPAAGPWLAVALAMAAAAALVRRALQVRVWTQREVRRSMTWLLLGTMVYTGLLCAAAGRWLEGLAVLACIAPARWLARRIALT